MRSRALSIPGVWLLEPAVARDTRGSFSEIYVERELRSIGLVGGAVQENRSLSTDRGVVRGLHFQIPPHAQDKLVRVSRGSILDVAVDIRGRVADASANTLRRFFPLRTSCSCGFPRGSRTACARSSRTPRFSTR